MRKNTLGVIFFLLGMASFLVRLPGHLTGGSVARDFSIGLSPSFLFGLIFIVLSFIILVSRQNLDAIVIPTGSGEFHEETGMYAQDEARTERALQHKRDLRKGGYFVVSGYKGKGRNEIKTGQVYSIYRFLREHGVKPVNMLIEGKSHDTLENVLYTLKKVKEKGEKTGVKKPFDIAFVSYPGHLRRINDFEKTAVQKGLFDDGDFRFHGISTSESDAERKYEKHPLRRIFHKYKLIKMGKTNR